MRISKFTKQWTVRGTINIMSKRHNCVKVRNAMPNLRLLTSTPVNPVEKIYVSNIALRKLTTAEFLPDLIN